MKELREEEEIKLQELKNKKNQLDKEYNELVKSEIDDDAHFLRMLDILIELDNIEDGIKRLEKSKSFDDDAR